MNYLLIKDKLSLIARVSFRYMTYFSNFSMYSVTFGHLHSFFQFPPIFQRKNLFKAFVFFKFIETVVISQIFFHKTTLCWYFIILFFILLFHLALILILFQGQPLFANKFFEIIFNLLYFCFIKLHIK